MSDRTYRTPCPFVNVMTSAALRAAKNLLRDFREVENLQASPKEPSGFVTKADRRAEKIIHSSLEKAYPNFSFLMEEAGFIQGSDEMTFVVDPLDGTLNFLKGLPHFAISIALCQDNEPIAGITLDPVRDELFWASKNLGAFLNRRRLRIDKPVHRTTHMVALNRVSVPDGILKAGCRPRVSGSSTLDLAYVAAGRFDGFVGQGLSPWDCATGILLLTEAQGTFDAPGFQTSHPDGVLPFIRASSLAYTKQLCHWFPTPST